RARHCQSDKWFAAQTACRGNMRRFRAPSPKQATGWSTEPGPAHTAGTQRLGAPGLRPDRRAGTWSPNKPPRLGRGLRRAALALALCFVPATLAAAPPPAAAASGAPAAVPPKPPAAANTAPPAALRIQDKVLYEVRRDQGRLSAAQRAQRGNEALREVVKSDAEVEIRVEHQAGVAVVFAGSRPILQLSPEDAEAAGDASLDVHAAAFAARLRDAVGSER